MEIGNTTPTALSEAYARSAEKAGRAVREYLGDPNEKNTKALRASVRRLSTVLSLVPKGSQSKGLKQTRRRCRKVLKATSKIRDADIIRDRLSKLRRQDRVVELLLNNLKEEREEHSGNSMRQVWRLFEQKRSKVGGREFRGARRWVRTGVSVLDSKVHEQLAVVLSSEGKVDELHSMRKNAKTLRYMLELAPPTPDSERAERTLKSWQDLLGEIRDADVVIDYLGRARQSRAIKEAIHSERTFRHKCYRSFVRDHAEDFGTAAVRASSDGAPRKGTAGLLNHPKR